MTAGRKRLLKLVGSVVVTGLCIAYIVWQIDVRRTVRILGDASAWWFLLSVAIMVFTVLPMAWRWQ